jgi:hypothetical protein
MRRSIDFGSLAFKMAFIWTGISQNSELEFRPMVAAQAVHGPPEICMARWRAQE